MSKPTDLVQGTVDLLILKTIALEPMHGWAIAQRIRQVSNEVLQVNQGALYPALHRLEQQGWIEAEFGARNTFPNTSGFPTAVNSFPWRSNQMGCERVTPLPL